MLAPPLTVPDSTKAALKTVLRDVWRASELGRSSTATISSGHEALDSELPGKGWPRSTLVELLLQQHGIGEIQLLRPALAGLSKDQRVALIEPPYLPNSAACDYLGLELKNILWVKTKGTADALWSTEQILKSGTFGAVLFWQKNIRNESLRRLNLAAQSTDTWMWLMRPMADAGDASPASLRMTLRPAAAGVLVQVVKRRGSHHEQPLFIGLSDMPARQKILDEENAVHAQRSFAIPTSGVPQAALV